MGYNYINQIAGWDKKFSHIWRGLGYDKEMTKRVLENFREQLHQCITNNGRHFSIWPPNRVVLTRSRFCLN